MTLANSHPTRRRWRWLALSLLLLPFALLAGTVTGVGFQAIRIHDPVGGGSMPGYVSYPSTQATGTTDVGPYHVAASRGAPAIPGAKPLVVISHGNGGSDLGHHDLATYLASHGFVVATLEHPKDNFHDTSGVGHASVLVGRPIVAGLAVAGADGVQRVIEILLGEFDTALALAGSASARGLKPSFVTPAPWGRQTP